ncbi:MULTISPECIES: hypothetical protein [Bacillus cereus group]|uniref:Uncharacterized protein n=1 Tax=Bacillus thuringiensis subsp. jegathesan TaxID=56955 RepID=A0A9X6LXC4_BACTJ|nr:MULTISPECIES: hypothetical protein [Bacillus cereus group]EJR90750.1 hypothetical protein IKA_02099 [Bacillus cereus VD169]MCC3688152.1 hypothetical protein [Bacillus cereus]MDA2095241.1 hypothetical protein [Bacillus cereus]MEB8704123.1 hypothetical protein [Bacillus cereus]OKP58473.1 hypothetical protein A8A07_25375 [Bacillus cereus]
MSSCKPIDKLTIEDLKQNPIWEWAIDEEENEEHDETWVKPATTTNFTEELNGSIVLGELFLHNGEKFPMMCEIDIEGDEAVIRSVVYYKEAKNEYIAIEDIVKTVEMPLSIIINLTIHAESKTLRFTAHKVDIYKNSITTNFN